MKQAITAAVALAALLVVAAGLSYARKVVELSPDTCARLSELANQIVQNRDTGVSEAAQDASLKANIAIPANAFPSMLDVAHKALATRAWMR